MAKLNSRNVARILGHGGAAATLTSRYDGMSAVSVDPDSMVRSVLDISPGDHRFGLALEIGGRAMNLLFPYPGVCCAHGLVKREREPGWSGTCGCGLEPIGPNPPREDGSQPRPAFRPAKRPHTAPAVRPLPPG